MTSVKIKFRNSLKVEHSGTIYFQIIHNKITRYLKTEYKIFANEWDCEKKEIILNSKNPRINYLANVKENLSSDLVQFYKIIGAKEFLGKSYTADDLLEEFNKNKADVTLFSFCTSLISDLRNAGKIRLSETYTSTINSFARFRNNNDIPISKLDSRAVNAYERWLEQSGLSLNSSSFYLRNLRAIYNRAVDKEITLQQNPFRQVYTGVEKTTKRAVTIKTIRDIKTLNLHHKPTLEKARDLFIFSFYTRGMSFIDMAFLKKSNLNNGILTYRRKKTRQLLHIKWESCMQEIADKYYNPDSEYILPIINPKSSKPVRVQYQYASHNINRSLKLIGEQLGLSVPLTTYVARHTWASIAKCKNIPISVISESMGHNSEKTTRIYLASLDNSIIDKANKLILKSI